MPNYSMMLHVNLRQFQNYFAMESRFLENTVLKEMIRGHGYDRQ